MGTVRCQTNYSRAGVERWGCSVSGNWGFPTGNFPPPQWEKFSHRWAKKIENRSVRLGQVGSLLFTKHWKGGSGRRVWTGGGVSELPAGPTLLRGEADDAVQGKANPGCISEQPIEFFVALIISSWYVPLFLTNMATHLIC